ncbi:transmembrane protein 126A [Hylaeus volcanicus]|uniref:transmembrane protein 126A n=1 Tax=Hylaeus volcanicus TaxID=313075 RepID=UPI0023B7DA93|nr:transmembrane protein 126A [Hylaeus volcanicus]XP_053971620.1 transmembrane protein 126A [Hylaeus volcanicus]XP_053971621.1 transmembrane protein 126A [Hylaeus volcanicus]
MALIPIRDKSKLNDGDLEEIPREEALVYQKHLLKEWKPRSEVWSLKYGSAVLGALTGFSNIIINSMFRNKLKLHSNGRLLTGISAAVFPGAIVGSLHETIIRDPILLYEYNCPLCFELKSSLLVNVGGLLFPLIAMPTINLAIAGNLGLRIPYSTEYRELGKFWWSVVKPGIRHIALLITCNTITASCITYNEILSAENLGSMLLQIEKYQNENEPLKMSK